MKGKLYIVATPIGNLNDFSNRAIDTLKNVDLIAAEDTRKSKVLLDKYEINNKLVSNHKFNEISKVNYFIELLNAGKSLALITDAGTPCISDPGYILIKESVKNEIEVIGIPGASAVITALSISGFEINSFLFYGFLPKEKNNIIKLFSEIKKLKTKILVFYESPKRILKSLKIISEIINDCNICLCNDLTKKYEKTYRGNIFDIIDELNKNKNHEKGEYVLIIEKKESNEKEIKEVMSLESLLIDNIIKKNCSLKESIQILSNDYNRNDIYKASLNIKELLNNEKQL